MNPFSWFSRPAWQARDPARRSAAVATGRDEMLIAALPLILRQDPDSSVRRAALERIDDLTLVADRMSNDNDPSLRERARGRFSDLLVGKAPLAERQRALKLIEDQTQLEAIARRAIEPDMRRAALERCTRAGFLVERCLDDADADLKLWLLGRIDARPSLERIAAQARTRDKRLFRAVRERLDGDRMAAGEGDALSARAEALCASIEARLRHPGSDAASALTAAEAEWEKLRPRLDDRFDLRFAGATSTLRATLSAISRIGEEPAPVEEAASVRSADPQEASARSADPQEAAATPPVEAIVETVARTEADETLVALLDEATLLGSHPSRNQRADIEYRWKTAWTSERSRPQSDQALATAFEALQAPWLASAAEKHAASERHRALGETALAELAKAIEAGQLGAARAARARVRTAIDGAGGDAGRTLKKQLGDIEPSLDKLAQWQRWSDDKVRLRLCEEVEELAGKGLHPDALASRIAELKLAWQKIEDSEHDPGAPGSDAGLGRRFRFLCHHTLEPAKPYFEKRREIRGKRAEELGEFLERVRAELANEATATPALIALKRECGERLRGLDAIDPRMRGETGKQIKQLMESLSGAVDARFATIAEEKQKLIAQLRRQLTHAELDAALDLAKAAQRRWQGLPKGTQKSDQALWQELRDLVDPLFAQKVAAGNAATAEIAAERAASQALIDEVSALAENAELDGTHLDAEITRCETSWRSDPARPREFERGFDDAVAKARKSASQRRAARANARLSKSQELATQLDAIESRWLAGENPSADLDASRASLKDLEPAAMSALIQRINRLASLLSAPPAADLLATQALAAHRLALEYEFLAGVESPAADSQARLNLQVEKLSARMSSGQSRTPAEERAALDQRWWATGPLSVEVREALNVRRQRALAALG